LNLVPRGANLGYGPVKSCATPYDILNTNGNGANVVLPKVFFNNPSPARPPSPTGVAFCKQCLPGFHKKLFVAFFNTQRIEAFTLTNDRTKVSATTLVYQNDASIIGLHQITAVQGGGERAMYFSDYKAARGATIKKLVAVD
jgi:hypothetical protein